MIFVYARFYLPVVLRKFKSKAQTLKKGFAFRTGQDWKIMSFGRLQNSVVILQIYSSLYPSQKKKDKNSDNIWLTDTKMLPFVLIIC